MASRHHSERYDSEKKRHFHEYALHLILRSNGDVRVTRSSPALARDEVSMSLNVTLPDAVFSRPELRATIALDSAPQTLDLNIDAAAEALKQSLGIDVTLTVVK